MPFVTTKESATLAREVEGVWVQYEEGELLIARMGNPHNRKVFSRASTPYRRQRRSGTLTDNQQMKIVTETYAETLLLDWRGMKDEDGKEFPYSLENAQLILRLDQDLRDFVEQASSDAQTFREEEIAASSKKSVTK